MLYGEQGGEKREMHQIVIRKAKGEDAPAMLEFLTVIGSETDNLTFGKEGPRTTLEQERTWLFRSNSLRGCFFLAMEDQTIMGTIQLTAGTRDRTRHVAEMAIAVRKECWGHGVATALFQRAMEWADRRGVTKVNLLVRADNERAKGFYAKCGFVKEGVNQRMFRMNGAYIDGEYWGLLRN
jgi:RimJ/RimL family protein N-acetyltransferase